MIVYLTIYVYAGGCACESVSCMLLLVYIIFYVTLRRQLAVVDSVLMLCCPGEQSDLQTWWQLILPTDLSY